MQVESWIPNTLDVMLDGEVRESVSQDVRKSILPDLLLQSKLLSSHLEKEMSACLSSLSCLVLSFMQSSHIFSDFLNSSLVPPLSPLLSLRFKMASGDRLSRPSKELQHSPCRFTAGERLEQEQEADFLG
eukprot:250089-Hanusia_phi.AAC.1